MYEKEYDDVLVPATVMIARRLVEGMKDLARARRISIRQMYTEALADYLKRNPLPRRD
jgi:hypothetical protein